MVSSSDAHSLLLKFPKTSRKTFQIIMPSFRDIIFDQHEQGDD